MELSVVAKASGKAANGPAGESHCDCGLGPDSLTTVAELGEGHKEYPEGILTAGSSDLKVCNSRTSGLAFPTLFWEN